MYIVHSLQDRSIVRTLAYYISYVITYYFITLLVLLVLVVKHHTLPGFGRASLSRPGRPWVPGGYHTYRTFKYAYQTSSPPVTRCCDLS